MSTQWNRSVARRSRASPALDTSVTSKVLEQPRDHHPVHEVVVHHEHAQAMVGGVDAHGAVTTCPYRSSRRTNERKREPSDDLVTQPTM
ncbi:MAG: hypothetical protein R3F39_25400 [Myxococcota bacterium]